MKASALLRKTPLRLRSQSRTTPRRRRDEPGRDAWKTPIAGYCKCGCAGFSMHLHRHHVVLEQHVRLHGGDPWDLANSLLLSPHCHMNHHSAFRRIPLASVPDAAVAFAVDLLGGDENAADYFRRYYAPERAGGAWRP